MSIWKIVQFLSSAWEELEFEEGHKPMLEDALEGKFASGLGGDMQRDLLHKHYAREHIQKAVEHLKKIM